MSATAVSTQAGVAGTVALVHLERPYAHARHYLGWAQDLDVRMSVHRAGAGSPLLAAALAAGIEFYVARTWAGDRHLERRLKRRHESPRLCPFCQAPDTPKPATYATEPPS